MYTSNYKYCVLVYHGPGIYLANVLNLETGENNLAGYRSREGSYGVSIDTDLFTFNLVTGEYFRMKFKDAATVVTQWDNISPSTESVTTNQYVTVSPQQEHQVLFLIQ